MNVAPVGKLVVTVDPAAVKRLLTGSPALYHAGEATARLLPFLGAGSVLLADESEHVLRRRRLSPTFRADAVASYRGWIASFTEDRMARWPHGRPIAVLPKVRALAFTVIARITLGEDAEPEFDELDRRLQRWISGPVVLAAWLRRGVATAWLSTVLRRRQADVDELLIRIFRAQRGRLDLDQRSDLLSGLLWDQGVNREGPISDADLCDEIRALLVVGHETTASALAWAVELLAHHPAQMDRLRRDMAAGRTDYLHAVIHETLRARAPVVDVVRMLTEPTELCGYLLPARTIVMTSPLLVHRRPDFYPDPQAFKPERFLGSRPDPLQFIPFGGGVRRCLGAALANLEMEVIVGHLVRRFDVRAPSKLERGKLIGTTMVPNRGAVVVLEERPGAL